MLLWIGDNRLSGTIPPELRDLASLKFLGLWSNNLSGPIPPELGEVTGLERVHLHRNNLTGPIPESFLELNGLELLRFERNADACAPGTTGFVTWLERIETVSGPYCNESDTGVLESLFEVAGGPGWTNAEGWLSGPSLGGWHGVSGRLTRSRDRARPEPQRIGGTAPGKPERAGSHGRAEDRSQYGPFRSPSIVAGRPLPPGASLRRDGAVCPSQHVLPRLAEGYPVARGHECVVRSPVGS